MNQPPNLEPPTKSSKRKNKKLYQWIGTGLVVGAVLTIGIVGSPKFSHFLPGDLNKGGFTSTAYAQISPVDFTLPTTASYSLNPLAISPQELEVQTWVQEVITALELQPETNPLSIWFGLKQEGALEWTSVSSLYDGAKNILHVEDTKKAITKTLKEDTRLYSDNTSFTGVEEGSLIDGAIYALIVVDEEIMAVKELTQPYVFTDMDSITMTPLDFITEEQHQILANLTALSETNYEMEDRPMLLANPGCNVSTGTYPDSYIISQAR